MYVYQAYNTYIIINLAMTLQVYVVLAVYLKTKMNL